MTEQKSIKRYFKKLYLYKRVIQLTEYWLWTTKTYFNLNYVFTVEHIKGFGLENFMVFKDKAHFDFSPLTILTGTNNSGKSTVINALRLLKENFKDYKVKDKL